MTNRIFEFKALVHLNNAGVSLLKRGCYRAAMETFGDGISVLKFGFLQAGLLGAPILRGSSNTAQGVSGQDTDDTPRKVQRAARRLSLPTASSPATSSVGNKSTIAGDIVIEVISDNDSPSVIEKASSLSSTGTSDECLEKPEKNVFHLVRMEPVDFEVPTSEDLSVEAAILLYNYGIAYRCLSSLSTSTPFIEKLNAGAIHLFHLANTSLQALLQGGDIDAASSNIHFKRIILMSLLSLRHLTDMSSSGSSQQEQSVRREYYAQQLDSLQPSVLSFVAIDDQFVVQSSPAA